MNHTPCKFDCKIEIEDHPDHNNDRIVISITHNGFHDSLKICDMEELGTIYQEIVEFIVHNFEK